MTQNEALQVLIQAVQVAQQKGAFTLQDAKVLAEAVEVFQPKKEEEPKEEPKKKKK